MSIRAVGPLILTGLAAGLVILNWSVLGTTVAMNIGLLRMDVPIGAVVLAFSGLLLGGVLLYRGAVHRALIRVIDQQRDEMRALRELAERRSLAELSELHELLADGLGKVHGRFDDAQARLSRLSQQFRTANDELRLDIQQLGAGLPSDDGIPRDRAQVSFMRMPDGSRAAVRLSAR